MSRNLIVCCDGTWNTPEQREQGVPVPTNVVKIYNALADADREGIPQLRYYHPGVGTEPGWWESAKGGATGAGLDRNILSAWYWLCDTWREGDRICLFGFSRGAYTVRSLAGLIGCCGLPVIDSSLAPKEIWDRLQRIFDKGYRQRHIPGVRETREDWLKKKWKFHRQDDSDAIPVHLIGVWDTVGSLGIPDDLGILNLFDARDEHAFHDVRLGDHVRYARHAVALDEMRASFQPTLWPGENSERLRQVWFPGVHADVGGGYLERGLSDIALLWMIDEARDLGVNFNEEMLSQKQRQVDPNPRCVLHDSCTNFFKYLPTQPRSVPCLDPVADDQRLHESVQDRRRCPPLSHAPYRRTAEKPEKPKGSHEFRIFALNPWNETGLYLEAGRTYRFSAEGEWLDRDIACGPDGTSDGNFHKGEVLQLFGTALGEIETLFGKLSGNRKANFRFTKRHDRLEGKRVPWFCLIGAIANGGCDSTGNPTEHETFVIGSAREFTPARSGYFYAYANDAWNFYGNNRGSVKLSVRENP